MSVKERIELVSHLTRQLDSGSGTRSDALASDHEFTEGENEHEQT